MLACMYGNWGAFFCIYACIWRHVQKIEIIFTLDKIESSAGVVQKKKLAECKQIDRTSTSAAVYIRYIYTSLSIGILYIPFMCILLYCEPVNGDGSVQPF